MGYAFGTYERDTTVFDASSLRVLRRQPLGATVRWLSNQQTFWDGRFIWTYHVPDPAQLVEAIAIDPRSLGVARTVRTESLGPAHSLMLGPDLTTAWVNSAGNNELVVLHLPAGEVVDRIETGAFP